MEARVIPIAQQYALSGKLFQKSLNGISNDELIRTPGEASNPLLWIAGHITGGRCKVLSLLGTKLELPGSELFARGSGGMKNLSAYPGIDAILPVWEEVSRKLHARLETLTTAELDEKSPIEFPAEDKSILSALSFFAFHETYHIGQMAYLLKWLGKEQLVG